MSNDDSEKPKGRPIPFEGPCVICGDQVYEWGKLADGGFTSSSFLGMGRPDARRCQNCGNVQVFHNPPFKYE